MNMKNHYIESDKKITSLKIYSDLAEITLSPGENSFLAGQFYILGIPGFGEAPFTPTNFPNLQSISFLIRQTGALTGRIFKCKVGDTLTLRGPYGKSFPFEKLKGKNIALAAGGCGLAPIKSALEYLVKNQNDYGQIQLFYGVNTPSEISYKSDLARLKNKAEILISVAKPNKNYRGNVGFVDKLISKQTILKNSAAILCGPPQMYDNVTKKLIGAGLNIDDIYLQLERRMNCGMGLCQHCTCDTKYVCLDGPAFSYREILKMNISI